MSEHMRRYHHVASHQRQVHFKIQNWEKNRHQAKDAKASSMGTEGFVPDMNIHCNLMNREGITKTWN